MQTTGKKLNETSENKVVKREEKILSSDSGKMSDLETLKGQPSLSKNLANSLMSLIDKVNADGVTPETVNASCNAAAQIYKILRLNYDMKKEGF